MPQPPVSASRRSRIRLAVLAAGLAALLVSACYWTFDAHELFPYRATDGALLMHVGETDYVGQQIGPNDELVHDATLDITGLKPVVTMNTAGALVRALVCLGMKGGGGGGGPSSQWCRALVPVSRLPYGYDGTRDGLVITVTPRHDGRVALAGVDVRYSDGVRRGEQHVGMGLTVVVHGTLG